MKAALTVAKARVGDERKKSAALMADLASARSEMLLECRRADAAEHALGAEEEKRVAAKEQLAEAAMVVTAQAASLRSQLVQTQHRRKAEQKEKLSGELRTENCKVTVTFHANPSHT